MNKKKKFLGILIFIVVFAVSIAIVMLLWNALIPSIIGWTTINYWQAAGLMILCRLLLGGFGRFGKGHFFRGRGHHDHRHFHDLRERMKGMSRDERRDYIREHMRAAHSFGEQFKENRENSQPGNKPE